MPLQIRSPERARAGRCVMLVLEPPGNIAREVAIYRRAIFALRGAASALALPESAPLAFALPFRRGEYPGYASVSKALDSCWEGIKGGFNSGALIGLGGDVFLALSPPLPELAARAGRALAAIGLRPDPRPILEQAMGIFICRGEDPESALGKSPPSFGFMDCSLALLDLSYGDDPFSALKWRELGRSRRRTGPSALASGRKASRTRE